MKKIIVVEEEKVVTEAQIKKYKKKRLFLTGQRSMVGWPEAEYQYSVIKITQRLFKKKKKNSEVATFAI